MLSHQYITKLSAACTVSPARYLWIQHTEFFWFLALMKLEKVQNGEMRCKLMCLVIDILLSGVLFVLYHQLDVYEFNIPNYFRSSGCWNRRRFKMENTIKTNVLNHRCITKGSSACTVSPARCLWIQHTKLFWFLGLMKPENTI